MSDQFVMRIIDCESRYPCFDSTDPHKHVQILSLDFHETLREIVFDARIYENASQETKDDELNATAAMLMMFNINKVTVGGPLIKKMNPCDIYKGPRRAE